MCVAFLFMSIHSRINGRERVGVEVEALWTLSEVQPYQKSLEPRHRIPPDPATRSTTTSTRKMEDDRAATNLGPDAEQGMPEEAVPVQKQPKRRFVGRKTAEKAGEQQADPNANIEDSSAIQGVRSPYTEA